MAETNHFRSLFTLNFGNYFNKHKGPIGDIYAVNDDALDGGRSLHMELPACSYIILLPVVGAVYYTDNHGNESLVAAGQVQVLRLPAGASYSITNPFKKDLVNFLQVWIKAIPEEPPANWPVITYDINEKPDSLFPVLPGETTESLFRLAIGKFSGRAETMYQAHANSAGLFVFVLEGAFEVEGRLLHARDGLWLTDTTAVEMEALSNDAILLLLELVE